MAPLIQYLNNFKLNLRILSLSAIPIIILTLSAILNVTGVISYTTLNDIAQNEKLHKLTHLSTHIGNYIHELQKERGQSAGYIGSGASNKYKTSLLQQQRNTNKMLKIMTSELKKTAFSSFSPRMKAVLTKISILNDGLSQLRSKVSQLQYTSLQMEKIYTANILQHLQTIKTMTDFSQDVSATKEMLSYISILEIKERAGRERATGTGAFTRGKFSKESYQKFIGLIAQQETFLESFKSSAPEKAVNLFTKAMNQPIVFKVAEMRDFAINNPFNLTSASFNAGKWFKATTQKIDLLKDIEDNLNAELKEHVSAIFNQSTLTLNIIITLTIIGITILSFFTYYIANSISVPLNSLNNTMQELQDGKIPDQIPATNYKSEIGQMGQAVLSFKEGIIKRKRLEIEAIDAEKERLRQIEIKRQHEDEVNAAQQQREADEIALSMLKTQALEERIAQFNQQITKNMSAVANSITSLQNNSSNMSKIAKETQSQSAKAADSALQTSSNVQTVAATTEQMAVSINEISEQMQNSTKINSTALDSIDTTVKTASNLAISSDEIGDVVNLIKDIAEQTNLLALNATIEAARAGESGKGFAVVASEVKALATQTASATNNIEAHISELQNISTKVVDAINQVRDVIHQNAAINDNVSLAVNEQETATFEISNHIQEVAVGTQDVSNEMKNVQSGSTKTLMTSEDVLNSTCALNDNSKEMKDVIDHFLQDISAL